jgi:hypothetical protein
MLRATALVLSFQSGAAQALTHIDDPAALAAIEARGFSFAELVLGRPGPESNGQLAAHPAYSTLAGRIAADLDERAGSDPYLAVTMAKKHRLFNKKWLTSPKATYELAGIFNRADRDVFALDPRGACGEIRFIYRLAYSYLHQGKPVYSRLPMTLNVVFFAGDEGKTSPADCLRLHRQWHESTGGEKIAAPMIDRKHFRPAMLKSVEINLQSVRWPSTVRKDMGGYAEYLLRAFKPVDAGIRSFVPAPMENMPDTARIKASPGLAREFKAWLRDPANVRQMSNGYGALPEKFLARKAVSVALYGSGRAANLPFSQLVSVEDFRDVKFSDSPYVKSAAGYLRRLNDMTCAGCHQGRAVAGFHFVGIDNERTHPANRIQMAASAHLVSELERRAAYLAARAGKGAGRPERPFSERPDSDKGGYGSHCALGRDPSFATWTCDADHDCMAIDTNVNDHEVGRCMPKKSIHAGDPCDFGRITWNPDALRDKMISKVSRDCGTGRWCLTAGDGFPGGLCFGECSGRRPGEACGGIAVNGFNECLGRGELFLNCLDKYTSPITTRACDRSKPCRDDFICAASDTGEGACVPPYFLFQLRADGHPKP